MRLIKTTLLAVVLLLAPAATAVLAETATLLPPAAGDLVPDALRGGPLENLVPGVSRQPVSYSWPLSAARALEEAPAPIVSRSREYWIEVDAAALAAGVAIETTAPGALVRINPSPRDADRAIAADALAIDPGALELAAGGERYRDGAGMELLADAASLAASGAPFAAGTSAFRLRPALGAGTVTVRAAGLAAPAGTRYVVHVLDAGSDHVLIVQALAADVLAGGTVRFTAAFEGQVRGAALDAFVSSPAGRVQPLRFAANGDGTFGAALTLAGDGVAAPGLWQVHVRGRGRDGAGHLAIRTARAPFALTVPTARLPGAVAVARDAGGLEARLAVEAAAAGRYELRGVLYGTAADGALLPMGVAHAAAWLDAGGGAIALRFGPEVLAEGFAAPFEVRDLRLLDQGRMGILERRARGLVIE